MSITSFYFLCLFALTLLLYYLVPKKVQWPLLLLLSIGYFLTSAEVRDSHAWYLILYPMAAVGAVWGAAILIDRTKEQKKKLAALICAVLFCVGLLCTLKFFHLGLLAPMGISFYTLTLLGYLFDVYYEIGPVQRSYGKLLLFGCYFPTMISGPIMKYSDMEKQMYTGHKLDYRNVTFGMQRMILGFFKKLVISERTAILANEIFNNYEKYSGVSIWVGAAAFTMQLYTDFDGCMDIVLGISECFGIRLPENFSAPFLSRSIEEYWRRWHISLGTWMKDYIFYPMSLSKGMNKLSKWGKKHLGNHLGRTLPICFANLVIFFIVGIWHGAEVRYIAYGLYNGIIIAFSNLCEPIYKKGLEKFHINGDGRGWKIFKIIRTFILVNIGWIFDCCALGMRTAVKMMTEMFTKLNVQLLTWDIFKQFELKPKDYIVIAVGCVVIFIVGIFKEKGIKIRETIASKPLAVRWLLYYGIIILALLFGYTDSGSSGFMYAAF